MQVLKPQSARMSIEEMLSFGGLMLLFCYAFSPYRFDKPLVFYNQIEVILVVTALTAICTACLCVKNFRSTGVFWAINSIDVILALYLLFVLLRFIHHPVGNEPVYKLLSFAGLYFVFRHLPSRLASYYLYLLPLCLLLQIWYGYQHLTNPWQGFSDIKGQFFNTGILGGFTAVVLISLIGLIVFMQTKKNYLHKIALLLLALPIGLQLLFSQSRAAWLAVLISAGFLGIRYGKEKLQNFHFSGWKKGVLVCMFLVVGILLSAKLYTFKKDSADGRLLIWTVSRQLLQEKPLTGLGPGGFQARYMLEQGAYLGAHPDSPWAVLADDTVVPFNEFLKIALEQGIAGLLLVVVILFLAFSDSNRKAPSPDEGGMLRVVQGIFAALLVFACFSYPFDYIEFQALAAFCLASIARTKKVKPFRIPKMIRKSAVCGVFLFCGITLYSLYDYSLLTKQWNRTMMLFPRNKDMALEAFGKLYPALRHDARFLAMYGGSLHMAERYAASITVLKEAMQLHASAQALMLLGESYATSGDYNQALAAYETASQMIPSLFKPHYNMAKIFFAQGDYEQAKQKAREVLQKKIKIDTPAIDRMKMEMQDILHYDPG
ncbi:MAG: O-antigen ligase family protein [Tannerella sp.]|nr:O-antigen ligase family protein [Tannerella sp.]